MSEARIQILKQDDGKSTVVMTGLGAGEVDAIAWALANACTAERTKWFRQMRKGTSTVGENAEGIWKKYDEARGF